MRAIMAVRKKEMRLFRASKLFEAPKSTLTNKVKSTKMEGSCEYTE
jgi:hypothetical protein